MCTKISPFKRDSFFKFLILKRLAKYKKLGPFAFVTRRIEYKHLRCAKNKTYYEFKLSFFLLFLCL